MSVVNRSDTQLLKYPKRNPECVVKEENPLSRETQPNQTLYAREGTKQLPPKKGTLTVIH